MPLIDTPKPADVLCGKDKTFGKHPGNMLYRDLIEAKAIDYASAIYKLDKMKLTTEIVATMVNDFGTRFLRPVGIPTNKVGTGTLVIDLDENGTMISSSNDNGTTGSNAGTTTDNSGVFLPAITSDGNATTELVGWEEISLTAARDKTSHALRFCASNTVPNRKAAAILMKQADLHTAMLIQQSDLHLIPAVANVNPTTTTTTGTAATLEISTGTGSTSNNRESEVPDADGTIPTASSSSSSNITNTIAVANTTTTVVVPNHNSNTSLIQSQLHAASGTVDSMSHQQLVEQQTTALQRGMEELIQQKLKQKEQEQQQMEQLELLSRQQQRLQQATLLSSIGENATAMMTETTDSTGDMGGMDISSGSTIALRKFKKLPTKASLTTNHIKAKAPFKNCIVPTTAELLNSTTTPVQFDRVKVQKSSRKPKMTTIQQQQQQIQQQQQLQQQLQLQQQMGMGMSGQSHKFLLPLAPSQVSPLSSPFINGQYHQHQQQPSIPVQHPMSLSSSPNGGRAVSTDMIVLAEAAAVVEAQEARAVAVAAAAKQQLNMVPTKSSQQIESCQSQ